ncbi:MAG: methionyl-tRNA formyltransferase [Elusimicrobia bacterium]|nr:methionyl-tRNA formyltransferase [Elusimicrobiota bacterium]
MRIVFFGTPHTAAVHLDALIKNRRKDIVGVITKPDQPQGRGLKTMPSPVKALALEAGLDKIFEPAKIKDEGFQKQLNSLEPDLGVVVAYGKILPRPALESPKLGLINVHFSLLPKLRGPTPVEYAILEGYEKTGVTIFWLDEGMDTGPILSQEETAVGPDEDARQLLGRLTDIGTKLLIEAVEKIESGWAEKIAQDSGLATYSKKLEKSDSLIDWSQNAIVIERKIRALISWPGCHTLLGGRTIEILSAKAVEMNDATSAFKPGQITRVEKGAGFFIKCGSGELFVKNIRPQGGRAMSAWSFLQGLRIKNIEEVIFGRYT